MSGYRARLPNGHALDIPPDADAWHEVARALEAAGIPLAGCWLHVAADDGGEPAHGKAISFYVATADWLEEAVPEGARRAERGVYRIPLEPR